MHRALPTLLVVSLAGLGCNREPAGAIPTHVAPGRASAPVSAPPAPASSGPSAATDAPGTEADHATPCPRGWSCDPAALGRTPRPEITEILVHKGAHRLHLVAADVIVRSYAVALGFGGAGPKRFEGDAVTPVGTYSITGRLFDTRWHTFLAVSYPSVEDQKAFAARRARGEVPAGRGIGFGIAIHGHRLDQMDGAHKMLDWTLGCVALDNGEIDEVASLVRDGTRVVITDE